MPRFRRRFMLGLVVFVSASSRMSRAETLAPIGSVRPAFIQSSEAGDRLRVRALPKLEAGPGHASIAITIDPTGTRQTIVGVGGALTEASAAVLARLPRAERDAVLDDLFGPTGLDLTMARTHTGSCDFSVEGRYSYDDVPGDTALAAFSLAPDSAGFAGARDPRYDLLPLLRDALRRQPALAIVASPWTAPAWMKDNGLFYDKGHRGGQLLPQHYPTFARYMRRYVDAYAAAGVPLWAVTPVNEPRGVGGQWESMEMSPLELRDYIGRHLGPALAGSGVRILQYDQNREPVAVDYARAVFEDSASARATWGSALHWYSATNSACGDVLERIRAIAPDKPMVMTEGCIDGIGTKQNAPEGRFLGWLEDTWWWQERAADWGWYWASPEDKPSHPLYAPVHRYARDLIDGLRHGFVGWIDWNLVLDSRGGPNHEHNLCGAPIMIDSTTSRIHRTPIHDVLAHGSRYVRPGDRVLETTIAAPELAPDDLHAVAVSHPGRRDIVLLVFNKAARALRYDVRIRGRHWALDIPRNALQTLVLSPPHELR